MRSTINCHVAVVCKKNRESGFFWKEVSPISTPKAISTSSLFQTVRALNVCWCDHVGEDGEFQKTVLNFVTQSLNLLKSLKNDPFSEEVVYTEDHQPPPSKASEERDFVIPNTGVFTF